MENMLFCQSCMYPLTKEEDFGTESNGEKSNDYCIYCYKDGNFTTETTMEEMIEMCVPMVSNGNPYNGEEEARATMNETFPKLKRWKK